MPYGATMPNAWRSWLALLLPLTAVLTWLVFAPATARPQGDPLNICVLRDSGDLTVLQAFAQAGRFDCRREQHVHGPGDFWAISQPVDARAIAAEHDLRVRFASTWQRGVAIHALYPDGHIETHRFDGRGTSRRIQLGAQIEQPLTGPGAPVRLLWRIDGSANTRTVVANARLMTAAESARSTLFLGALYSSFAGLCIALLVYNLALWGALNHRFQLAYCAMITGLLCYTIAASGALAWIWPNIANNDRITINCVSLSLSAAAAMLFVRTFFEQRVFAGMFGRVFTAANWLLAAGGFGFALLSRFDVGVADRFFSLTFLAIPLLVPPVLWRAWRQRSQHLWIFAIAWSAPIACAVLRLLANLHIIRASFWIDNSTLLAMALEALLSAVAIAYRFNELAQQRDEAVEREIIARRLADTDPLTGLLNRRAFLDRAIGRAGPQMLLIADLDHFKGVNETLGHDGGDEVLRIFARTLRASVPGGALISRMGGEEFAIVSALDHPVDADSLLARLRTARMPFDLTVTASIGTCTGPLTTESDWKSMYRGADRALFDAKSAGRDRARRAELRAA